MRYFKEVLFATVLIIILFISCTETTNAQYEIRYNINKPDAVVELPVQLNEISGLTDIDKNFIACTQDELGIIFIVDINSGKIKEQYKFEPIGDFEGLTRVNNSFYILRSDGRITFLPDFKKPNEQVHIKENLPTKDNEGLCYYPEKNTLLIAAKSKPSKESAFESNDRLIYQFDIKNSKLDTTPVFTLKINDIISYAQNNNIELPVQSNNGQSKKINFRPSSIAVHPVSKQIYIISAADFLLVVCDERGKVKNVQILNPELFAKAEGITFLPDNTMIITNEAKEKFPVLLKFKYNSL